MPMSRSHESEADSLGLQLAARACFDPRRAIRAHEVLREYELNHGRNPAHTSLGASHPSTDTRLADLKHELSAAVTLYEADGCGARRAVLMRALGLRERGGGGGGRRASQAEA